MDMVRKRSKEVSGFADTCRKLGLPLKVSESLIRGLRANTLGGEMMEFLETFLTVVK